ALANRLAGGQHGLHPGQDAAILDGLEMVAKLGQVRAAAKLLEAERQHLIAIVSDDAVGDFAGACGKRAVARVESELAASYGRIEQNFQIDFVIGHIDAGRIVDRVGVDTPAGERVLDARLLGESEVAAFDDYFGAKVRRGDSACVVGVIGDFGFGLGGGANVSPDAAVVQQIDG